MQPIKLTQFVLNSSEFVSRAPKETRCYINKWARRYCVLNTLTSQASKSTPHADFCPVISHFSGLTRKRKIKGLTNFQETNFM